jgi:hypothetical protein
MPSVDVESLRKIELEKMWITASSRGTNYSNPNHIRLLLN